MADHVLVILKSLWIEKSRPALLISMSIIAALLMTLMSTLPMERLSLGVTPHPLGVTPHPASQLQEASGAGSDVRHTPGQQAEPRSAGNAGEREYFAYVPILTKDWCDGYPGFRFEDNILSVSTQKMVLMIEGGAIVYAQDKASGEVLMNTDAYTNRPSGARSFVGFISLDAQSSPYVRWPVRSSLVTYSRTCANVNTVRLIYSPLYYRGTPSNSQLIVDVTVDTVTGEIIIQLTGIEDETSLEPSAIDMPIMNITTPAVILGSGARYARTENEASDRSSYNGLGLFSPTMAVVEGWGSTLAVWSETTQFAPEDIRLEHKPGYDHLILHAEQDPKQTNRRTIVSPPWRIGIYPTWTQAARRWRERFEARTGAQPLWESRTPWVRNIHAVFDATNQTYNDLEAKHGELASKAAPEKVLYFLWNGDRIVLHGDHTLLAQVGRPSPAIISTVKRYGWPFMLFHPYTLIYSVTGAANRLQFLAQRGWLPAGYQFNPDYEGAPQGWRSYWADVSASYPGGVFDILHPGSSKFKNYLVRNIRNYCALYRADGVYLDTSGDYSTPLFPEGRRVVEGQDYTLGEINAMARVAHDLPDLAVMTEYQSTWIVPYAFYSWEGSVTHLRQSAYVSTRINHPLRVALVGSYSWTRESNTEYVDDITAALLGSLPQLSLVGDHNVSNQRALWSQARARLFTEEELFNDLPDQWADDALAYYRSKNGNWFKFKMMGSTYGYVEILPDGQEVVRLVK